MIAAAAMLLAAFAAWAILGRVPTIASGRGVILRPRQIVQTQTVGGGMILTLQCKAGDHVRESQLLATVDQEDLTRRIGQDRRTAEALEDQDRRRTAAESAQLDSQPAQDKLERSGLEAQRSTLAKSLADVTALKPILETHAESNRKLVKEGLLGFAAKEVSDSESAVGDNDAKIYDFTSRPGPERWPVTADRNTFRHARAPVPRSIHRAPQ